MEFSRPGYWSGTHFPSPGDLPNTGIEPGSPALQMDSLPTELLGKPQVSLLLLSHFSRVRLCATPIDSSPPGSPVPRILQARTLEWVAISFSNAWKCKVKGKSLSLIRLLATPWTAAYRVPPSIGFSRQEYWSGCHCLLCRLAWPTAYRSKGLLGHLGGSQINNCLYTHPQKPGVWHHNLFLHERINPFILKYKLCVITE